jgi:hypothetical protein
VKIDGWEQIVSNAERTRKKKRLFSPYASFPFSWFPHQKVSLVFNVNFISYCHACCNNWCRHFELLGNPEKDNLPCLFYL